MKAPDDKNMFEKSREHLANERTFLAWIRTSIALMGFGFVIVKFALFLKQISILLDPKLATSKLHSSDVGVIMIALGVFVALLAFLQFKKHERQLKNNSFYTSSTLMLFVTLVLMSGGIILILYLLSVI
jgi:putative membrane protein